MLTDGKGFREFCRERVATTLSTLGLDRPAFGEAQDGSYLLAEFEHRGRVHRIEIYDDGVVMLEGQHLFEPYMPAENESLGSLVDGFTTRLSRYLAGGPWEGPAEKGPIDRIRAATRTILRKRG